MPYPENGAPVVPPWERSCTDSDPDPFLPVTTGNYLAKYSDAPKGNRNHQAELQASIDYCARRTIVADTQCAIRKEIHGMEKQPTHE
jgi:hypothetical protein